MMAGVSPRAWAEAALAVRLCPWLLRGGGTLSAACCTTRTRMHPARSQTSHISYSNDQLILNDWLPTPLSGRHEMLKAKLFMYLGRVLYREKDASRMNARTTVT